jgi:hypothetical protein
MRKFSFVATRSLAALPVIANAHGCIKTAAGAHDAALKKRRFI